MAGRERALILSSTSTARSASTSTKWTMSARPSKRCLLPPDRGTSSAPSILSTMSIPRHRDRLPQPGRGRQLAACPASARPPRRRFLFLPSSSRACHSARCQAARSGSYGRHCRPRRISGRVLPVAQSLRAPGQPFRAPSAIPGCGTSASRPTGSDFRHHDLQPSAQKPTNLGMHKS